MEPRTIPLTRGLVAIVDAADYDAISQHKWSASICGKHRYAARWLRVYGKKTILRLHNFLMGDPPLPGMQVDHKNGDGLDNRRSNLRWASGTQNMGNQRKTSKTTSSQYKGVTWEKRREKWQAQLSHSGNKRKFLGYFANEESAAKAYDAAAIAYFGEFARTNFATAGA